MSFRFATTSTEAGETSKSFHRANLGELGIAAFFKLIPLWSIFNHNFLVFLYSNCKANEVEEEVKKLKQQGFSGFYSINDLRKSMDLIPEVRGVYVIIRANKERPQFLEKGSGGFFKGKDPNVDISILTEKWNSNSPLLYIGKAGDPDSNSTLRKRIRQYLNFGSGKNIGHYGGRYIWQLSDSEELIVAWKPLPEGFPTQVESDLLEDYMETHNGRLPFANLTK